MARELKEKMILFTLIWMVLIFTGLGNSQAQQYFNMTGKVISLYRGTIIVQGDKGETMNFAVGRRTIYIPNRLPGVGERVKMGYYFQRGRNVAYQVEILPSARK